jgi:hypothetical protein
MIREVFNKIQQAGAFLGGWLGTGSVQLGIDEAAKVILEQDAKREKLEEAQSKISSLRRKRQGEGFSSIPALSEAKQLATKSLATDLNALQKVGAYTSQTPERREMSRMVKTIEKSTEKIARNTEPASFDSGWTRY